MTTTHEMIQQALAEALADYLTTRVHLIGDGFMQVLAGEIAARVSKEVITRLEPTVRRMISDELNLQRKPSKGY